MEWKKTREIGVRCKIIYLRTIITRNSIGVILGAEMKSNEVEVIKKNDRLIVC